MKKGTKIAALLLGLALVIPACTPAGGKSSTPVEPSSEPTSEPASAPESQPVTPSSEAPVNYTVTISNKTDLQAEWFAGDQSRKVEIAIEPRANIAQLISEGKIEITSSNPQVLSITGQMANPVAAGEATIKVKCGASEDTVAVTLKAKQSVKEKYGVAHEGTAEDPFDNEDALVVAKHEKYNNEDFYVRGEVASFYHAPGSRTDGACSWFLKPAEGKTEKFEISKCYKKGSGEASYLTDDDIWVGGIATAHGTFTVYQGQYETSSAEFVKCEGTKPQPRQTLEKSFAEVLAVGAALADGDSSWDYYKFQGYVTVKSGNNYYLTATKGEALVSAKSDADHGNRDMYSNAIELYNAGKVAELAAKLLEGAKVEVTMIVKNYHGTIENGKDLVDADVTVVEAGTQWAVAEPAVGSATLAEFIALENTKAKAYNVTAKVKSWKNADAAKDKYGNMVLTDGTNDLVIYGSSATATALAWDNASAYAFTNPQDFLTNEVTAALNIGDEVTMKLIRADYNGAVQGTGIITKVVPAGAPVATLTVADSIAVGDKLIMSAEGEHVAQDGTKTPFKKQFNGIIASGSNKIGEAVDYAGDNPVSDTAVLEVVAGSSTGTFALKLGEKYLTWKSGNTLDQQDAVDANASWSFTFADGKATIANSGDAEGKRKLQYNSASPRFATYTSAQKPVTLWKITGGDTPANAYPTFKWSDAIQEGSSALDGTKFNKNATYNLKVENVPAAGNYTITLPMMGSDGNGSKTINGSGQDFTISANGVAGTILVAGKSYTEVFGENQKAWVDVVFAEVALVEGSNAISLKTGNGGYRVSVNADGNVTLAEAAAQQQEVAQPSNTFSGLVSVQGQGVFTTIALADSKAFVEIGSDKATVDYTFDKATGLVTIPVGGNYGNLTGTYDPENGKLINCGIDGAAAAAVTNNGSLEFTASLKHFDAEGTDAELQAIFKRRVGSAETGLVSADTTNFIAGKSGVQLPGNGSGDVRLNLKQDIEGGVTAKNLGFWVYNPSSNAVKLRMWVYKAANLGSNAEIASSSGVEFAPGWTYYRIGFAEAKIYNIQIGDFSSSGVNLTFDNIAIF